jgi:HPt (histidine-containing phosphotransfer) domain-containing protein
MDGYLAKPADPKLLYALINQYPARPIASKVDGTPTGSQATDATADGVSDVIDWGVADSLTGGSQELLGELIEMFPEESRRRLDDIRDALEAGDAERLARGAHSLKSAAAMFGASALVAAALEVETLGHEAKLADVGVRVDVLEAETARVCAALAESARG